MKYVGKEFIAKNHYPFDEDGVEGEDFSYDIKSGERVKVESYDDGHYKLINLSVDGSGLAWVLVAEDELEKIKG